MELLVVEKTLSIVRESKDILINEILELQIVYAKVGNEQIKDILSELYIIENNLNDLEKELYTRKMDLILKGMIVNGN